MSEGRDYVWERNELIPAAVKFANESTGPKSRASSAVKWSAAWNSAFHGKMKELARKTGLTKKGGD